jgi:hypothetical protein
MALVPRPAPRLHRTLTRRLLLWDAVLSGGLLGWIYQHPSPSEPSPSEFFRQHDVDINEIHMDNQPAEQSLAPHGQGIEEGLMEPRLSLR